MYSSSDGAIWIRLFLSKLAGGRVAGRTARQKDRCANAMTQLLNSMERAHSYSPPMLPFANVNTRRAISIVIECIACSSYERRSPHLFMHEPNRHETLLHMLGSLCLKFKLCIFGVRDWSRVSNTSIRKTMLAGHWMAFSIVNANWKWKSRKSVSDLHSGKIDIWACFRKTIYRCSRYGRCHPSDNMFWENVWKLILNKSGWCEVGRWNCRTRRR